MFPNSRKKAARHEENGKNGKNRKGHKMVKPVVDIWRDFLAGVSLEEHVLSYSAVPLIGTEITVDNIYHLRPRMSVLIDSFSHEVTATDRAAGKFSVAEVLGVAPVKVVMPSPVYFHGTPQAVNAQMSDAKSADKLPCTWLYEVLREKEITQFDSLAERSAQLRWFVLDETRGEYNPAEHYANVINGARDYVDKVLQEYEASAKFVHDEYPDIEIINHANFGEFLANAGYRSHVLDETISGVEVRMEIQIKRSLSCG